MIVRDEAERLEACLRSAAPYVSETIVVDTGSRDGTPGIAERLGARVFHHAWESDFAKARNVALTAATQPWILVLDADETLEVGDPAALAHAIRGPGADGYRLACHNRLAHGESIGWLLRLFRREHAGARYEGALHEQLRGLREGTLSVSALEGALIRHEGYRPEVFEARGKAGRNAAIARSMVERAPQDPFAWYCLGQALGTTAPDEGLAAYRRAWALGGCPGEPGLMLAVALGRELLAANAAQEAGAVLDRALSTYPDSPDLAYLSADLALRGGDAPRAAGLLEASLARQASGLVVDPAAVSFGARGLLALAYRQLGRLPDAEDQLERALAEPMGDPLQSWRFWASSKASRGDWTGIANTLPPLVAAGDVGLGSLLVHAFLRLERWSEAATFLAAPGAAGKWRHEAGLLLLWRGAPAEAASLLAPESLEAFACAVALGREGEPTSTEQLTLAELARGAAPTSWPEGWSLESEDALRFWLRAGAVAPLEAALNALEALPGAGAAELKRRWGRACALEGQSAIARALLERAEAWEPDEETRYWLGYCAMQEGDAAAAQQRWSQAPRHALSVQALALFA